MASLVPPDRKTPIFNVPPVTLALLIVNVAVHAIRLTLPDDLDDAVVTFLGFVPARYGEGPDEPLAALVSPFTYAYLHASLSHLGLNMLSLLAFGAGVERRLGAARYVAFYTLCGLAAALAQLVFEPSAEAVLIGASGAISGLFAAILRFGIVRRGFWGIVVLWLILNVLTGTTGIGGGVEPIAWVAHIGGFACGLLLFGRFDRRFLPRR